MRCAAFLLKWEGLESRISYSWDATTTSKQPTHLDVGFRVTGSSEVTPSSVGLGADSIYLVSKTRTLMVSCLKLYA